MRIAVTRRRSAVGAWFEDGDLETLLSAETRDLLTRAAAEYDPRTLPAPKSSVRLD